MELFQDLGHARASTDGPASLRGLRHADDGLADFKMVANVNLLMAYTRCRQVLSERWSR
jgi:hypothetical protein